MLLAMAGVERGFPTSEWATYKQLQAVGAQVRKGETGEYITKWVVKKAKDEGDEKPTADGETSRARKFPVTFKVFNVHQADFPDYQQVGPPEGGNQLADQWINESGSDLHLGGDRAYYVPANDRIYAPGPDQYDDVSAFYSVCLHEHVHWTGHPSRLDRDQAGSFGSDSYAREELVAELGAAFACARIGISNEPRPDHAAYLENWLSVLKEDPKALFRAAAAAQRAVDLLDPDATDETPKPAKELASV